MAGSAKKKSTKKKATLLSKIRADAKKLAAALKKQHKKDVAALKKKLAAAKKKAAAEARKLKKRLAAEKKRLAAHKKKAAAKTEIIAINNKIKQANRDKQLAESRVSKTDAAARMAQKALTQQEHEKQQRLAKLNAQLAKEARAREAGCVRPLATHESTDLLGSCQCRTP